MNEIVGKLEIRGIGCRRVDLEERDIMGGRNGICWELGRRGLIEMREEVGGF